MPACLSAYLRCCPLACSVPVGAAVLCHVAQQLPDAAYLTAARQLQEELQACWINGVCGGKWSRMAGPLASTSLLSGAALPLLPAVAIFARWHWTHNLVTCMRTCHIAWNSQCISQ